MLHNILDLLMAQERQREWIATAAQEQRANAVCGPRRGLLRRAARPVGRLLIRAGTSLLRYGRAAPQSTTRPYRASSHSIELN
jgi:hypothetical protein